ncbi:MAG: class I SAM-dependent methyltransferase [Dongiaceae bacterium]
MRWSDILHYGLGGRSGAAARDGWDAGRPAGAAAWLRVGGVARRIHPSYEAYLAHQAARPDEPEDRLRARQEGELALFHARFAACRWLAGSRSVLCLGARLGSEVRALHALGHFALGIDLAPGLANLRVLQGDFHRLVFPDRSLDTVYSHAFDHAFDLDRLLDEIHRVLRPHGVLIADLTVGTDEGHRPGAFASLSWTSLDRLLDRLAGHGGFAVKECRSLGNAGLARWRQVVLVRRLPAQRATPAVAAA